MPAAATPHARAAFKTIDSRRAAIFTPHRARRHSLREARETPRDFLLPLGRVLARNTVPIPSSSSSPDPSSAGKGGGKRRKSRRSSARGGDDTLLEGDGSSGDDDDDDDDVSDDLPIKRPRFSLPIDEDEEDDDDPQPHRSAGLEDENFTVQSIELPRRAAVELPGRFSMGSVRMSDYFGNNADDDEDQLRSEEVGIDSGFFPPVNPLEEVTTNFGLGDDDDIPAYARLDSDAAQARLEGGRESDFHIEVPAGLDEDTFEMAPNIQDSPVRQQQPEADSSPRAGFDDEGPMFGDLQSPRSDSYGSDGVGGGLGDIDDEPLQQGPEQEEGLSDEEPATNAFRTSLNITTAASRLAALDRDTVTREKRTAPLSNKKKISRHGIEYKSLPPTVVKRLAQTFAASSGARSAKITPEALKAIMQASDWFFEQVGDDLQAYAAHAHRKTIDESDMLTLMKRQRQINATTTPFSLAQKHLPRELLQELRMPPPPAASLKKRRRKPAAAATADEGEGEEEENTEVT